MAINLNDNLKINVGNPIDSRYLNSGNTAYVSTNAVKTAIPISQRYLGLTVLVDTGTSNIEYWWREGVQDVDLVEKKFASEQLVGDFITGATNLGYFSGQTGIQRLDLSSFPADGYYFSELNWYYGDADGIIRIGSPTHDGPLRRAYVNAARDWSWIYDVQTTQWVLSNKDVIEFVGSNVDAVGYAGSGYTEVAWSTGFHTNGSTSITAAWSLTTGATVTVGAPVYSYKSDQDLHLRTIMNETPQFLKIEADDYYIRFSGVSSVITATNYGGGLGVYSGKTGTNLKFRTLVQSGDTSIIQKSDGRLVIYSSSDGSADAITGATNYGVGVGVYSGTTARNLGFRTIVGSGDTSVSTSGGTIIIESSGGESVFTSDLIVSIAAGKTFGKYENGDVIPASGKTAAQVIELSILEALDPTVNLSSSGNNVAFGESGKTVNLNFSYVINTLGANVASVLLEWRRGGAGTWSGLTTNTGLTVYNHTVYDIVNRFNTAIINYRYTVIDSAGASGQTTHDVTPIAYAAPSMVVTLSGNTTTPETLTSREKGNVISNVSGTITANSSLVDITDWTLERRYDGGGYIVLASGTSLSTQLVNIPITLDNSIPTSATSIDYRITYTDEYTSGAGGTQSITFKYFSYYGFNTNTTLNSTQIQALINSNFLSSVALTWNNINTPISNYTYYAYPNTYSDITNITKNGVIDDTGAWTLLVPEVNVTNTYGESLNYKVYKTNATLAYGSTDDIVIT